MMRGFTILRVFPVIFRSCLYVHSAAPSITITIGLMLRSFALLLVSAALRLFAADLQFSAAPQRINSGASVVLHWDAGSASSVILLGHGKVDPSGSLTVAPIETTLYTLVADGSSGLLVRTLMVEVQGARGVDFPSNEEQFRYPLSDRRKIRSQSAFLDGIHRLLQHDLGFSVKAYSVDGGVFIFLTNSSERPDLVGDDERRKMRARRISYRLEVQDQGGRLAYTLKTLIEFQLRAEETWRKEGREDLYQRMGADLLARLALLN
jgi:hypothetical protein